MGILEQNMSKIRFGGKETGGKQQNRLFLHYPWKPKILPKIPTCANYTH